MVHWSQAQFVKTHLEGDNSRFDGGSAWYDDGP
jgi:hypothetical protein